MRTLVGALILAAGFMWGAAAAQDAERDARLVRALEIATEHAGEPGAARAAVDSYLATLPRADAVTVELDLLKMAVARGHMQETSSRYAREQMRIVRRYLSPSDALFDPLIDFWGYRIVIDSRMERGEIPPEERDYLVQRKAATLHRQQRDLADRAEAARQARLRADFDREQAQQEAEAMQRNMMLGNFLRAMGRSMQQSQQPPMIQCSTINTPAGGTTLCR